MARKIVLLITICGLFVFGCVHQQQQRSIPHYAWIELGPDSTVLARAIMDSEMACPRITLDHVTRVMHPRSTTSPPGFTDVMLCEITVPTSTKSAMIGQQSLVLPVSELNTIVIVGDTGCRVQGEYIQNCTGNGSSGALWDFANIADAIVKINPDLIIHVGDYHYREFGICDNNCIQSNIGYTWASWEADFFNPARHIMAQAPWIFVRGNHEDCTRAWRGWFYFLDPNTLPDNPEVWNAHSCSLYTDPYLVTVGSRKIVVMDSATIPDDFSEHPDAATVMRYAKQFNQVESILIDNNSHSAWLTTHRPIWGVASFFDSDGHPAVAATDLTLQQAIAKSNIEKLSDSSIEMLLSGHIHLFEMLNLDNGRPLQWVFGGGGTMLDPGNTEQLLRDSPQVLEELGVTIQEISILRDISFGVMSRTVCGWTISVKDVQGQEIASYSCQ